MDGAVKRNNSNFVRQQRTGLTLLELVIVVAILAILATAVIPVVSHYSAEAKITATQSSLTEIRNAIMGTPQTSGFLSDVGRKPNSVAELFTNPTGIPAFNRDTKTGWNGPYLLNGGTFNASGGIDSSFTAMNGPTPLYGGNNDPALLDPWGNPVILQHYKPDTSNNLWLLDSAGNLALQVQSPWDGVDYDRLVSAGRDGIINTQPGDLTASSRGDDMVLFLYRADAH